MSKVYDIGLHRYRNQNIRVCDKNSIPLTEPGYNGMNAEKNTTDLRLTNKFIVPKNKSKIDGSGVKWTGYLVKRNDSRLERIWNKMN